MLAERVRETPVLLCGVLAVCLAAVYLVLWRTAPEFRVFRLMGFYFALAAGEQFWRYFEGVTWDWVFAVFTSPLLVATALQAMRFPRRRWAMWVWPMCALALLLGWTANGNFVRSWPVDMSQLLLGFLVVQRLRKAKDRERWVAAGFALFFVVRWTVSAEIRGWTRIPQFVQIAGWRWYLSTLAMFLAGLITLWVYLRDLLARRQEEQRLASEREAGLELQQMLLLSTRQTPGSLWRIDPVYIPAAEVGGDFFAVVERTPEISMLVIGDVSCKGMRAAMVVATVLGALRQDVSGGPAEVLSKLNRTLVQSGFGGFATCLCALLGSEAELRFASAGHLPPYVNGAEVDIPGTLPLGLVEDAVYREYTVGLAPENRALFLSNGVVEAKNAAGDLFGFQRTRLLSRLSASEIVAAARRFGQVDDITAITVTRMAADKDESSSAAGVAVGAQV